LKVGDRNFLVVEFSDKEIENLVTNPMVIESVFGRNLGVMNFFGVMNATNA
jgi:hypothetical protein